MDKNQKGISLITLVVTIVVLIILAGITIYSGAIRNIDSTTDTMALEEIINIGDAVATRKELHELRGSKYQLIGEALTAPVEVNGISYQNGWYKLNPNNSTELGLENIKGKYIVNYDTCEVVSLNPIYFQNEVYYAATDLKEASGVGDVSVSSDDYDELRGVNKPQLLTGMIPVKYLDGKWVVTNASDKDWYDYSSQNKIWANVMLMDEITIQGYENADIRNASLVELEGREVINSGSMFVWIPRYSSNGTEITYSSLLDDYTENGFTVNDAFNKPTARLGYWISKYDAEYK